jgi:ABC-2 type transport system ATP-binding protein
MTEPAPILSAKGLACKVGAFQLGPLDLTVPEGSITALIGPNGAGKTTLMDLLYGLGRPGKGQITVAGMALPRDELAVKRRVGFVSPDLAYASWGKIGAALDFVSGFYPDWRPDEAERLLDLFQLSRKAKIAGLSFGERTRLSLIVALARDTDLLLLDEPTTGLDVAARKHLFAEILRYVETPGRAVIISSHQLSDLERLADHVVVLNRGTVMSQGPIDDLVDRYQQWDIAVHGAAPSLPASCRLLASAPDRLRVMADLGAAETAEMAQFDVLARVPMTLEEVYLGLTGEAA